jgi:hypothetical protein
MQNPFNDFLAVHESIEKRDLIRRLEKALIEAHHSEAFLAQRSGVSQRKVRAMLSCDIKSVSRTEIEKVLGVV